MSTLTRAFPVARKHHRCMCCRSIIPPGEQYHYWTGTSDMWPGVQTLKECAGCCARYGRAIPQGRPPHEGSGASGVNYESCPDCKWLLGSNHWCWTCANAPDPDDEARAANEREEKKEDSPSSSLYARDEGRAA